jgi:peptidylprolyl isomerase
MELDKTKGCQATLHTSDGDIVVNLFTAEDPITVNNFVFLATQGFYNNVPFHRVIKNFMIQTGDPTGTGTGGPGYRFADEPVTRDYTRGTVAMANAGPNTNGSQFFIVQADMTGRLPKNYTIFGEVTGGMDVVDKIANTQVTTSATGEQSKPVTPITIKSVDVVTK